MTLRFGDEGLLISNSEMAKYHISLKKNYHLQFEAKSWIEMNNLTRKDSSLIFALNPQKIIAWVLSVDLGEQILLLDKFGSL